MHKSWHWCSQRFLKYDTESASHKSKTSQRRHLGLKTSTLWRSQWAEGRDLSRTGEWWAQSQSSKGLLHLNSWLTNHPIKPQAQNMVGIPQRRYLNAQQLSTVLMIRERRITNQGRLTRAGLVTLKKGKCMWGTKTSSCCTQARKRHNPCGKLQSFLGNLKLPCDSVILLLCMDPKELKSVSQRKIGTPRFTAVFVMAKIRSITKVHYQVRGSQQYDRQTQWDTAWP